MHENHEKYVFLYIMCIKCRITCFHVPLPHMDPLPIMQKHQKTRKNTCFLLFFAIFAVFDRFLLFFGHVTFVYILCNSIFGVWDYVLYICVFCILYNNSICRFCHFWCFLCVPLTIWGPPGHFTNVHLM